MKLEAPCPNLSSKTSNFPFIRFVPAGCSNAEPGKGSADFVAGPVAYALRKIGPLPALPRINYSPMYPKGLSLLQRHGWRHNQPLGARATGLQTPLGVVVAPSAPCLIRENLCPLDSFQVATLRKSATDAPANSSRLSVLPHVVISIFQEDFLALVDSGSEVTCINEEQFLSLSSRFHIPSLPVASTHIRGATGQQSPRIKFQVWLEFSVGGQTSANVFLVVKNLIRPVILGVDWLSEVDAWLYFPEKVLSIRVREERHEVPFQVDSLVSEAESVNSMAYPVKLGAAPQLARTVVSLDTLKEKVDKIPALSTSQKDQLLVLLERRRAVFNELPGRTDKYVHTIKMHDTTPFLRKAYPIPFSLRPEVETVIKQMMDLGVVKREASPFASPMTAVRKKDGSVRVCLDARWINKQMVADCEAPRPPEELLQSLQSVRFLSTIDLRSSYWQIPLSPESTQYTAFLFNGQSYTYQVLPFGLKTAVGSFSRAMDVILGPEVREFAVNYIDDLLIASNTFEQHLEHLDKVLTRLQEAKMTVNLEKSTLLQPEVKFLGHLLSAEGVTTDPDKVRAIQEFPVPKSRKHLRAFLGLCGYYRRFCNKYSHSILPLTRLLRKESRWKWTGEEQESFAKTKELFLEAVILKFPDFNQVFYLQTDGSGMALGAELYQVVEGGDRGVLGFASRVLRGPELLYTVTEKELLAIIFGLQKFRTILLGHKLIIRTDHYALKFLKQFRLLNDRLTRG